MDSTYPEFEGSVVIVTGAARGIGKSTARAFCEQGASVVLVDIDQDKLEETRDEIQRDSEVRAFSADVSDSGQVESLVSKVAEEFHGIDVVVNNAGKDLGSTPVVDVTDYMWGDGSARSTCTAYSISAVASFPSWFGKARAISSMSLRSPGRKRTRTWPRTLFPRRG